MSLLDRRQREKELRRPVTAMGARAGDESSEPGSSGSEAAGSGDPRQSERAVQSSDTAAHSEGDEFAALREDVEAVLLVARDAAARIKARAESEADVHRKKATRKASDELAAAERKADELRSDAEQARKDAEAAASKLRQQGEVDAARARQEAEKEAARILEEAAAEAKKRAAAAKRDQQVLEERLQLTQGRLHEMVTGLRDVASHLEELLAADAAAEDKLEERELDEVLHDGAQARSREH
jgi:hypothetical protein